MTNALCNAHVEWRDFPSYTRSPCLSDRELFHVYLNSGRLADAQLLFQRLSSLSNEPGTWTTMLAALSENGRFDEAFRVFQCMQLAGVSIDSIAFLSVLNACTRAEAAVMGTAVHGYAVESGFISDVAVATAVINMYGKCGCSVEASRLFSAMNEKNVVTWSVMVAAFARDGDFMEALSCLRKMQLEGVPPNKFTLVNALKSCSSHGALSCGRILHSWISESGLDSNLVIANALVSMYSRCGGIEEAVLVFEKARTRDVIMWTAMIAGYSEARDCDAAFRLFQRMQLNGIRPDKITFITLLNSKPTNPTVAEMVDELVSEIGWDSDAILGTALIEMYSNCGRLHAAFHAFERISQKHVVPWSALISANVDHGEYDRGLLLFRRMQLEGVTADKVAFITVLGACSASRFITDGKLIHQLVAQRGFDVDTVVGNALIEMYGRCRDLVGAVDAFNGIAPHEDVVSWNSLIAAHGESGLQEEALLLFNRMQLQGIRPDRVTFISVLNSLSAVGPSAGKDAAATTRLVCDIGQCADPEVEAAVLRVYTSRGFHEAATELFSTMQRKSIVCWNMVIGSCSDSKEALQQFHLMQLEGDKPDTMTLATTLNACARGELLEDGKSIHECFGCDDELVSACLIRMYSFRRLEGALQEFRCESSIGWNGFATACADNSNAEQALYLVERMQLEGFQPDEVTLSSCLNACQSRDEMKLGVKLHEQVLLRGWESDTVLGTALMNMYASCGRSLVEVVELFSKLRQPDVVSFNALITAYVLHEELSEALDVFRKMQLEGFKASKVTMVTVLNACSSAEDVKTGRQVHSSLREAGYELEDILVGNALVTMYGRCGESKNAERLFHSMSVRDVASWNTMMTTLNDDLQSEGVIRLFHRMQLDGTRPDVITFLCMLNACTNLAGSLAMSSKVTLLESLVAEAGLHMAETVQNGFMNLYSKSGNLEKAGEVFQRVAWRGDLISWNSMIAAYSQAGDIKQAMQLFLEMQLQGIDPDGVTFISILSSCSHSGQVATGLAVFTSMSTEYGIPVTVEHYGCMVDLYGRSGRLKEAEKVLEEGNVSKGFEVLHWMIMLSACMIQNEIELGELAAKKLMGIHPCSS